MPDNSILSINNPYSKLLADSFPDNDILSAPTPRKLEEAYRTGKLHGVILAKTAPYPFNRFAEYNFDFLKRNQADGDSIIWEDSRAASQLKAKRDKLRAGTGSGKRVMGHYALVQLDPSMAGFGAQGTGDCVSWAIRGALDRLRARLIVLLGKFNAYIKRQATCGIYSGRGHTGQGADPVTLSFWAVEIGTLLEQIYEISGTIYDFTSYANYMKWGMTRGRIGVPDDLLTLTKPHTAAGCKVIKTTEGARDFMYGTDGRDGGTIHCGSDISVSSSGNPVSSRTKEGWSHDMDITGFDDTREFFPQCIWIWDQSWGGWNTVTNIPEPWKPWMQGQFALPEVDTQWAMNDGGTVGFMPGSWFKVEPPDNLVI